jgi:hypothetical protein
MKNVSEKTGFPLALLRAVARQIGGWDQFRESATDIANHGIDGGFHGFIYYTETVAFWRKNRVAILDLLTQQAEELGTDIVEMVCSFNCLRTEDPGVAKERRREVYRELFGLFRVKYDDGDDVIVANALTWYAAEEAARAVDWYQDEYGRHVA